MTRSPHPFCSPLLQIIGPFAYPKLTEATEKSVFGEKRTLNGKISQSSTKRFMRTPIPVFLPSFVEIGKAKVIKRTRDIHHEGKLAFANFAPFSGAPGAISPKKL